MSSSARAKKELEQEKLVAGVIVDIRTQRGEIEKVADDYFEYAVEAAEMGQDEFATELLETIAELKDFAENLKFFELKIKTAAITAKTLGKLRDLPQALNACKQIFCKGPNFKKLGKDMASLLDTLGTARKQFKDFRVSLGKTKDPVYAEVFGKEAQTDPKLTAKVDELRKALTATLVQRQKGKVPTPAVASEGALATDGATQAAAAKVDAIAALLDEEKKRKP